MEGEDGIYLDVDPKGHFAGFMGVDFGDFEDMLKPNYKKDEKMTLQQDELDAIFDQLYQKPNDWAQEETTYTLRSPTTNDIDPGNNEINSSADNNAQLHLLSPVDFESSEIITKTDLEFSPQNNVTFENNPISELNTSYQTNNYTDTIDNNEINLNTNNNLSFEQSDNLNYIPEPVLNHPVYQIKIGSNIIQQQENFVSISIPEIQPTQCQENILQDLVTGSTAQDRDLKPKRTRKPKENSDSKRQKMYERPLCNDPKTDKQIRDAKKARLQREKAKAEMQQRMERIANLECQVANLECQRDEIIVQKDATISQQKLLIARYRNRVTELTNVLKNFRYKIEACNLDLPSSSNLGDILWKLGTVPKEIGRNLNFKSL